MKNRLLTMNGYPLGEVVSALQKTIRRGQTEDAFYWAMELEPRYYHKLWERLMVIACEDIGCANSQISVLVWNLYQTYLFFKDRGSDFVEEVQENGNIRKTKLGLGGKRQCVAHAIRAMCTSPKSRDCDEMIHWYNINYLFPMDNVKPKPIPDFAHDVHTGKGRQLGRDMAHFWSEGTKLEPDHSKHERLKEIREFYDTTRFKPINSIDRALLERQRGAYTRTQGAKPQASMDFTAPNPFEDSPTSDDGE